MKRRSLSWMALVGVGLAGVVAVSAATALAARSAASPFELTLEYQHMSWEVPIAPLTGTFTARAPFCGSGTFVELQRAGAADAKYRLTCDDGSGSLVVSASVGLFDFVPGPPSGRRRILENPRGGRKLRGPPGHGIAAHRAERGPLRPRVRRRLGRRRRMGLPLARDPAEHARGRRRRGCDCTDDRLLGRAGDEAPASRGRVLGRGRDCTPRRRRGESRLLQAPSDSDDERARAGEQRRDDAKGDRRDDDAPPLLQTAEASGAPSAQRGRRGRERELGDPGTEASPLTSDRDGRRRPWRRRPFTGVSGGRTSRRRWRSSPARPGRSASRRRAWRARRTAAAMPPSLPRSR